MPCYKTDDISSHNAHDKFFLTLMLTYAHLEIKQNPKYRGQEPKKEELPSLDLGDKVAPTTSMCSLI